MLDLAAAEAVANVTVGAVAALLLKLAIKQARRLPQSVMHSSIKTKRAYRTFDTNLHSPTQSLLHLT